LRFASERLKVCFGSQTFDNLIARTTFVFLFREDTFSVRILKAYSNDIFQ
jgi:hypothetical protein